MKNGWKNARNPRLAEYRFAWGYIRRRYRGLMPALQREAGENDLYVSWSQATVSKKRHGKPTAPSRKILRKISCRGPGGSV